MSEATAAFRFGYGLPLPKGAPTTPKAMMAALMGPDEMALAYPTITMAEFLPMLREMREKDVASKEKNTKAAQDAARAALQKGHKAAQVGARAAFARAVESGDGLRERLVAFWCDHFTTTSRMKYHEALPTTLMTEAIRPNLTGDFAALLTAVTLHPAMLLYLDQASSIGPGSKRAQKGKRGLNENLARELLELHTVGVTAGYSQADVRELAELLTGLAVSNDKGFGFDAPRAEPGPETVLGVTYEGKGLEPITAMLRDLSVRPETARHIAGKLAVHFLSDQPDEGVVKALETAWMDSGGDLAVVTKTLLDQDLAWSLPPSKARMPFEFLACSMRALGVTGPEIMEMEEGVFTRMILKPMQEMGQPWQEAPGPDGWPEEPEVWINPQRLASRITWSMEVPGRLARQMPDPRKFAARALGERASERLVWAATRAESLREGVGLILASAEFNRR